MFWRVQLTILCVFFIAGLPAAVKWCNSVAPDWLYSENDVLGGALGFSAIVLGLSVLIGLGFVWDSYFFPSKPLISTGETVKPEGTR